MEVQWYENKKDNRTLIEAYQSMDMKFSFVSSKKNGRKQCHRFVICRDFLHDVIRTQLTGKKCLIYGFKFEKGINPPIDSARTQMLITKDEIPDEFNEYMKYGLKLLRYYEKISKAGISRCTKIADNNNKQVWLFSSPAMWMSSPALISMYSLLIRLGAKKIEFKSGEELLEKYKELIHSKKKLDSDTLYLKAIHKFLEIIVKHREYIFDKKDNIYCNGDVTLNDFHNYGGIVSLCEKKSKFCHINSERMLEIYNKEQNEK